LFNVISIHESGSTGEEGQKGCRWEFIPSHESDRTRDVWEPPDLTLFGRPGGIKTQSRAHLIISRLEELRF